MKSNGRNPSYIRVFPVDSLNKNIPRKNAQLLKTSVSKTYKPSRGILQKRCSENSNKPQRIV